MVCEAEMAASDSSEGLHNAFRLNSDVCFFPLALIYYSLA